MRLISLKDGERFVYIVIKYIAASLTMLQKMIDIVVDEARNIDMTFNASKSAVIRIGKNYKHSCAPPAAGR